MLTFSFFSQLYRDGGNTTPTYTELRLPSLADQTTESLTSKIFSPRRASLEKLVAKAEEIARGYPWKKDISVRITHTTNIVWDPIHWIGIEWFLYFLCYTYVEYGLLCF